MAERINAVKTSFFGKGAIRLLGPELQKMGIRLGPGADRLRSGTVSGG